MKASDIRGVKFVCLISLIEFIVLLCYPGIVLCSDTNSYVEAWERLSNFEIDPHRTPIYPLLIGVCKFLSLGKATFSLVVLFQILLFFLSVRVFHRILLDITNSSKISFWITFFYAVFPAFTSYHITILTESLALSGSVLLLGSLMGCLKSFSFSSVLSSSFWLFFLIFLRPSSLYLLPIVPIIWIFSFARFRNWLPLSVGFLCIVITLGSLHFYMVEYKDRYGLFSTSDVGLANQYYLARQYNYIEPEYFSDIKVKGFVEKAIENNSEDSLMIESFQVCSVNNDLAMVQNAVSASIKNNPVAFIKGYFIRLYWALRHPVFKSTIGVFKYVMNIIGFSLNTVMLMLVFHVALICYSIKKESKIPIKTLLLFTLSVANLFTITLGAQEEWSRLFLPSLPCILIMFGQYLKMVSYKGFAVLE